MLLKNAPHTMNMVSNWTFDYSIERAMYPVPCLKENKFHIPIGRVNNAIGDKKMLAISKGKH